MAEFSKYQAHSVGRLLAHNNRYADDTHNRSNENIDYALTKNNFHYKKGTVQDVQNRLNEVFVMKKPDTVVLGEMIVSLPDNVSRTEDAIKAFFSAVYDFYVEDFGEENIINAVIHLDETTPHIHIDFIPVIKEKIDFTKRGAKMLEEWKRTHGNPEEIERLCCKDLINREYLNAMHPRLSDYVSERMGYKVDILNGATINGNKKMDLLKMETLHNEVLALQKQSDELKVEINQIHNIAKEWGINEGDIGLVPLMRLVDDLEKQNTVLRSIIERKGYTYSNDELKAISTKKFVPSKVAKVSVMDGSLTQVEIPQDAIVVIELPIEEPSKDESKTETEKEERRPRRPERYPEEMMRREPSDIEERHMYEEAMAMERARLGYMRDRTEPMGAAGLRGNGVKVGTSPQQALLDREREIARYVRNATQQSKDVFIRESRMTARKYVYIKTYKDKPEKVISAIITLEQTLREMEDLKDRTIYIDRITGDKYDMARSALSTLDARTMYFTRRDLDEKSEEKNLQQTKE